jgi:UPF0755 protein
VTRRHPPLLLLAAVLACADPSQDSPLPTEPFTVPRGATLHAVAESLHTGGFVESPGLFRFYATISGKGRAVQAGTYDLPRGASPRRLLSILVSGRPALRRLAIPEGLTLAEIARAVEIQLALPAESVLAAARDDSLREALGVPASTLEGYLYPSTYYVRADATARDVVRQMAAEFEQRWQRRWDRDAAQRGMTRHAIVTLASIIEGEVRHDVDRRYVASVYANRLQRGMRLQADPTVIYALGERRRLYERDYRTPSDYNTYLIDGLPPGPIGSPTAASIAAALHPAKTSFLYFVARQDGLHVFSRTYAEHLRTIARIRGGERPQTEATRNGARR